MQLNRWDQAERVLLQSISLLPSDAYTLTTLGYEWTERDVNLSWAPELLERAHRQDGKDPFIRDSLGWNYVKLGMIDAAIPHLDAAISAYPNLPDPYAHLGEAYRRSGNFQKAETNWRRALTLKPNERLEAWVKKQLEQLASAAR